MATSALKSIALFELKTRLSRISTWVYFGVFFTIAMLWIAAAGGIFKEAKAIMDPQDIFNPKKKADAVWDYSFSHIRDHF